MKKLNILATSNDGVAFVVPNITIDDVEARAEDYPALLPRHFAQKYGDPFKPTRLYYHGTGTTPHNVQFNFCINPFCAWFGQPQKQYLDVKYKPSRYKIVGSSKHSTHSLACNIDPTEQHPNVVSTDGVSLLSNWSAAEEIVRLAVNDSVVKWEPEYDFHYPDCTNYEATPSDSPDDFHNKGKSKGNSTDWKCIACGKRTNVLPGQRENFSYRQKRNDILPQFANMLVSKVPVRRTCELLKIGVSTYYNKLEWTYRRCLEFLERHEFEPLRKKAFREMWISTDQFQYNLNNVRRKGSGGVHYDDTEDPSLQTKILVSADGQSRYVFRADVGYDWNATIDGISEDTKQLKCDHLYAYAQKNARLRFPFEPQPPTEHDTETATEYLEAAKEFKRRSQYITGLHVNPTYTALAHFWLLRRLLNVKEWRFVTDDDNSLRRGLYAVYADSMRSGWTHHFHCLINRDLTKSAAWKECQKAKQELRAWAADMGYDIKSLEKLARLKMFHQLRTTPMFSFVDIEGKKYGQHTGIPLPHPIPTNDQGIRFVDCLTDASGYDLGSLGDMLLRINNRSTDAFMNQMRRRLSILERPLVTARMKDGKSYIYSNFNPKYAQYAVTILRTYYNFCMPIAYFDRIRVTPAQRLGIAERRYDMNDILYAK